MWRNIRKVLMYFLLVGIALYLLTPFIWTFVSSIKLGSEMTTYTPVWIPRYPTFNRYLGIFTGEETLMPAGGQVVGGETLRAFKYGLINSLIVAGSVTLICLSLGSFAAYSFARLKSRGRNFIFSFIISLRLIPLLLLLIPMYIIMQSFHLLDTIYGLILVYCSFILPLTIWLMKTYFEGLPIELEDAARIDGCSRAGVLFRIVLPLSTPGLVATGLLAFTMAYAEFMFALVLTSSLSSKTLPVVMGEFFGRHGMDYGMVCTGAILASIPLIIIALVGQKYIVKGLTMGIGKA